MISKPRALEINSLEYDIANIKENYSSKFVIHNQQMIHKSK